MELIDALKFVRGVIRKNKLAPELEHYRIKDGRVTGFNGHMALSAPCGLDFEAYPKAKPFAQAVEACADTASMHLTASNRLAVRSGGFKAFIPCLDDVGYAAEPAGESYACPEGFVPALEVVLPFIAEDASRPWAMGLLLHQGMMMATNNVVLVQKWTGHQLPRLNLPRFAVQELVRVGKQPETIRTDGNSVSFIYDDGRWLRTQLYDDGWPFEKLDSIMGVESHAEAIPENFATTVDRLTPFLESKADPVYFAEGELGTTQESEEGAHIACDGVPDGPIFSIGQLQLLATVATSIDWSLYPSPCIFYGENLRGAVIGRVQ